jgi:TRAP-type C4-dicarboxylate transport system permease small subunit
VSADPLPALKRPEPRPHSAGLLGVVDRLLILLNRTALFFGMAALVAASLILTYSVGSRYFFKASTDWQDEAAVFCLVGATFLCGAWVQAQRGHVGIEAIASVLSRRVNRVRQLVVDAGSAVFCAFFAWKSWTLFHEAWVDKMTTSSTWAPPLTIPYGLMAAGMTLLVAQLALQVVAALAERGRRDPLALDGGAPR